MFKRREYPNPNPRLSTSENQSLSSRLVQRIAQKARVGQGLVEFALAIPIFLVMLFGVVEGGRYMFFKNSVASASREAARFGSAEAYLADCTGIVDAAERMGFFAGVTDEYVSIRYVEGNGKLTDLAPLTCGGAAVKNCPYSGTSDQYRIVVDVLVPYEPIVPLINWGGMCVQSQNARTVVAGLTLSEGGSGSGGPAGTEPPAETEPPAGTEPPAETEEPVETEPPKKNIHIGDIDSRTHHPSECACTVTAIITVHDKDHNPESNVLVTGYWKKPGESGSGTLATCTTNASGICEVQRSIPQYHGVVTYRVTNLRLDHGNTPYESSLNHDPDGNSNGTSITINH